MEPTTLPTLAVVCSDPLGEAGTVAVKDPTADCGRAYRVHIAPSWGGGLWLTCDCGRRLLALLPPKGEMMA